MEFAYKQTRDRRAINRGERMSTFTKSQWRAEAAYILGMTSVACKLTDEEAIEVLDYLWDYLPPRFHSAVIKRCEFNYSDNSEISPEVP